MSEASSRELLEARIARERDVLAATLGDLRESVRTQVDPRCSLQTHPALWVAGAVVIGLWLGVRR